MSNKPQTPPAEAATDPVSRFESDLGELETIVGRIESGELSLEESLRLFERGTALARQCRHALASAELRVQNLLDAEPEDPDAGP